jgi:TolA-binding protein
LAIATYGKVIQLNPEDEDAWFNLGRIFWNAGMLDDAAEVWNEAIERFPGTEQALKAQLKMAIFMP